MEGNDPVLRVLTAADLDAALGLSAAAGWNQRIADWRMLLQLAPAGAFCAVANSTIVGTAIGIDYRGKFGWIAMMLVDPAWRGRGIGARLLEAAMSAVPAGLPIRLDATPLGRPLYRRYGFDDETRLTRHVADASRPAHGEAHRPPSHVRRLTPADLPMVSAQDEQVFGAHRQSLLQWLLDGAPQYARAIETDAGTHYCFGRPGRLFDQIGPVVADDERARALVGASLVAAEGRAVVVDAFDRDDGFGEWLRGQGFRSARPLFRMCRPGARGAWAGRDERRPALDECAILGPEFG